MEPNLNLILEEVLKDGLRSVPPHETHHMLHVDHARIPFGRMLISYLIASSPGELKEAAGRLGLGQHIQHAGTWKEHLDVSESKRLEAVQSLGAREVSSRELVKILRERRRSS